MQIKRKYKVFSANVSEAIKNPNKVSRYLRRHFRVYFVGKRSQIWWTYPAYWKYRLKVPIPSKLIQEIPDSSDINKKRFITIVPNQVAGIGHQLANWNTALILSHKYNLTFIHHPFAPNSGNWEDFLGFGEEEAKYDVAINDKSIKRVNIPLINLENEKERAFFNKIITSIYPDNNILFHLSPDQNIYDHTITSCTLRERYWQSCEKRPCNNSFDKTKLNIAVHIRRGDVADMREKNKAGWKERWLANCYYIKILRAIEPVLSGRKFDIHIYSIGNIEDFKELRKLPNVVFHLNEDTLQTFHGMIVADILIVSPSGFSYFPGIISKGIKIAKYPWWHHIPQNDEWIRSDKNANFNTEILHKRLKN